MPTTTEKWAAFTNRGTVLTTEMNSLINAAYTAVGTVIDNSVNLDRFGCLLLSSTWGSAPVLNSVCRMYALVALDGTNYEDGGSSVRPTEAAFCGVFQLQNVTSAQLVRTPMFELVPSKTKFVLFNGSGQTMAASASTVTLFTTNRTFS